MKTDQGGGKGLGLVLDIDADGGIRQEHTPIIQGPFQGGVAGHNQAGFIQDQACEELFTLGIEGGGRDGDMDRDHRGGQGLVDTGLFGQGVFQAFRGIGLRRAGLAGAGPGRGGSGRGPPAGGRLGQAGRGAGLRLLGYLAGAGKGQQKDRQQEYGDQDNQAPPIFTHAPKPPNQSDFYVV